MPPSAFPEVPLQDPSASAAAAAGSSQRVAPSPAPPETSDTAPPFQVLSQQPIAALVCDTFDVFGCEISTAAHDELPELALQPRNATRGLSSTRSWVPAPDAPPPAGERDDIGAGPSARVASVAHTARFVSFDEASPHLSMDAPRSASTLILCRFSGRSVPSLLQHKARLSLLQR